MGNSKRKLRILSFLGVLILSGGLLLGLFQEARAVNITVTDEPNSINTGNTVTFTVSIEVPQGEKLPIQSVRGIVEETSEAGPDFSSKRDATVVADATCPSTVGPGLPKCTQFSDLTSDVGDAVRKVEFTGGTPGDLPGYGYEQCSQAPAGPGNANECSVTHTGYDFTSDQGQGYGYERPEIHGQVYDIDDTNAGGYGYDHGTLTLQWDVTVDAGNLNGAGNYWLTFIVNTGSSVISKLEGKAHYFEVSSPSGTPGGGGGGGADDGIVNAGLGQAFDVSANQRVKILLENELDNFRDLLVEFNQECNGCSIHVNSHGGGPPSGTPAVDNSFRAIEYFSIEVQDEDGDVLEGYIDDGSIEFDVPAGQLDNEGPGQVILKHRTQGTWTNEETRLTSDEDADPLEYNGTFGGFSVFAKAVDTQPPTISNQAPTGSTSAVTPTIEADFSDNRGINPNTLILRIDQREQSGQSGSLDVGEDGFSFVPASELSQGEHDVFVSIEDDSGLETTREWTFRVSEVTCPEPPRITQVQPSEGATDVSVDPTVRVTVQQGSCEIASSVVRVNGQEVSSTLSGGTLTAELSDLGFEEQVSVTAIVTDAGENTARKNWQFTTEQEGDTTEPPTEEDGNALVWIIIALVVLAIIGVGAYFYTQQEGGGPGGPPGGP